MLSKSLLLLLLAGGNADKEFGWNKDSVRRFLDHETGVACYVVTTNTYVATISCVKFKDETK